MRGYLGVVMLINFCVDLLLILAADRLRGYPVQIVRCLAASALGGIYSGACLLPGFGFLGSILWRTIFLIVIGLIAFGWSSGCLCRCMTLLFLNISLDGIVRVMGNGGSGSLLSGVLGLCVLCYYCFGSQARCRELVEVELFLRDRSEKLLALRDTGNGLRDPVTGQSVLVADAKTAEKLLGLNQYQLRTPVETVASGIVPGLRLIPYRTVGQSAGMLVAIRLDQVRIGKWRGSSLVAFAPEGLGEEHTYRALTGGMV